MMQFCGEPGCGALVPNGRCATHTPRDRYTRPVYAATHAWYGSLRWRLLRAEMLRAEPFCRACRADGHHVLTHDIDHITKHAGDPAKFWDRSNLQGLCKPCHTRKTTWESRGDSFHESPRFNKGENR